MLRLQLLLIVSQNCFENSFAGGTAYETQWLHMVTSYHAHAESSNTPNTYGTSEMLHHPGASPSEYPIKHGPGAGDHPPDNALNYLPEQLLWLHSHHTL